MDSATLQAPAAPPLAAEIAALAHTVPGVGSIDDLFALALLAHASSMPSGHMVVVGAGHGRTALALGAVARACGRGRVFAIDLFPDVEDSTDGWSLDSFLGHTAAQKLLSHVLPHHGTGASFAHLMPEDFQCRLILLEGARACPGLAADVALLERHLAPGGWLCVNGAFSRTPGADDAIAAVLLRDGLYEPLRQLTPGLSATRKRD